MYNEFILHRFYELAAAYPDRIAIEAAFNQVTYGELARRARCLCAHLVKAGVSKGSRVVSCVQARYASIEHLLGILSCGGALVALDTSVPSKRMASMLYECEPTAALVEGPISDVFIELATNLGMTIVSSTSSAELSEGGESPLLDRLDLGADDLIYIVFTSGSTGAPKAIAGRRRGVDHFIRWEIETFNVNHEKRVSQLTSPMFDAYFRDIFAPLCSGASICVPPHGDVLLDGSELAGWLKTMQITHLHTVPSLFRSVLQQAPPNGWPSIDYALLAGEHLLPTDVRRWYEVNDGRGRLVNLYGPSETTMTKFVYMVTSADRERRTVPIGKPMPGVKAAIFDSVQKICKVGVVGEIYIRTPNRSLGYFKQPSLTDEVFIQNPLTNDADDIVFKTGDLARVLPDGNFELIGRRDQQLKIRGVRVDPSEIESIANRHPAVAASVVAPLPDETNTVLVAYVTSVDPQNPVDTGELRTWLMQWLPAQSIPGEFVHLDRFPLTANGKVDRKRLPKPALTARMRPARDGEEQLLCAIFSSVLHRDSVGIEDNFFQLGGHSLLAAQVAARIRSTFRIEFSLRMVFEHPSVLSLAKRVRSARSRCTSTQQPAGDSDYSRTPCVSYAQERMWYLTQLAPESVAYNLAFALRLNGNFNLAAFAKSISDIVQRHDVFRTSFKDDCGAPALHLEAQVPTPITMIDLQNLDRYSREGALQRIAAQHAHRPFALTVAPLLRIVLVRTGSHDHAIFLCVHHIIYDAWSTHIFLRELDLLYKAYSYGRLPQLPRQQLQYWQIAAEEKEVPRLQEQSDHLTFWKQYLSGCKPSISLPTDFQRPTLQSFRGDSEIANLPTDTVLALRKLANASDSTEFIIILALVTIWLYALSDEVDLLVGTPVSNRKRLEEEDVIGLFINTIVFRNMVNADATFLQHLRSVRENCLEVYGHQEVAFEKVVDELGVKRHSNRSPLFQVMLNIEHTPTTRIELGDIEVQQMAGSFVQSRFDLHVGLRPHQAGMDLILIYNADIFTKTTAKSLLTMLIEVSVLTADDPQTQIGCVVAKLKELQRLHREKSKQERLRVQLDALNHAQRAKKNRTYSEIS